MLGSTTAAASLHFDLLANDRTSAAFNSVRRQTADLDRQVKGLAGGWAMLGKALPMGALIGTITAASRQVKSALDDLSRIKDVSQSVGLGTDAFQALGGAALQAGVNQDQLNSALLIFTARVGAAREGQGELVSGLKSGREWLTQSIVATGSQEEALKRVADAIDAATTAEEKAVISKAAFGRAGVEIARVFDGGAAAIDNWVVKGKEMGFVLDKELIERADKLGDEFDLAMDIVGKQFSAVLVDAAPAIVNFTKDLAAMAKSIKEAVDRGQEWYHLWQRIAGVRLPDLKLSPEESAFFTTALKPPDLGLTAKESAGFANALKPKVTGDKKKDQVSASEKMLDMLRFEQAQLGRTNIEQEIYNNLKRAGVSINSEAGQQIAALTEGLEKQKAGLAGIGEVLAANRTPLEEYRAELERLRDLQAQFPGQADEIGRAFTANFATMANKSLALADIVGQTMGTIFEDNKAVAIAQSTINTLQGVTAILAQFGATPWGLAMAGATAALGAAQIAKIQSTSKHGGGGAGSISASKGGGGGGSAASTPSSAPPVPQTIAVHFHGAEIFTGDMVRELFDAINKGQTDGYRITVID